MEKGKQYSVKQLAKLAGISVRTLHVYDQLGLLKPAVRTEARYRLYGETELLRLQQILFYKELDLPLQEIAEILDDPAFDVLQALENHRETLQQKEQRLHVLLNTIDKTINYLKGGTMLTDEELYEGLDKEKMKAWEKEAREKYGDETIDQSQNALRKMSKPDFEALKKAQADNTALLLQHIHEDPKSEKVQTLIAKHYEIIRKFWGTHGSVDKQAEQYKGLGKLYVDDERYTMVDGKPNREYALFMQKGMSYFADSKLNA